MRDGMFGSKNHPGYCSAECFTKYRMLVKARSLVQDGADLKRLMNHWPVDQWPQLTKEISNDGSVIGGNATDGQLIEVDPSPVQVTMETGTSTNDSLMSPQSVAWSADFRVAQALSESINFTFTLGPASYNTEFPLVALRCDVDCTINACYLISTTASSGSDGSNYWTSEVKNAADATALCSAPWDSNGDELASLVAKDLAVDQNQSVDAGDIIYVTVKSTGSPTSMNNSSWSWVIKATPR